jgi:hypothetical protein
LAGSTEVAVQEGQVPALRDRSQTLTAEDLAFPRLYIGQDISEAVKSKLAESGDLFLASDQYDPDPSVLAKKGSETGVTFYVVGWRKGISRSIDGQLDTWKFDDPTAPPYGPGTDAWISYTYFVAIPGVEEDVPVRFLISRTSQPAARKINTVLNRLGGEAPYYKQAFRLTTELRHRKEGPGTFYVAVVLPVEGTDEGREVAAKLAGLVDSQPDRVSAAAGENPTF